MIAKSRIIKLRFENVINRIDHCIYNTNNKLESKSPKIGEILEWLDNHPGDTIYDARRAFEQWILIALERYYELHKRRLRVLKLKAKFEDIELL